MNSYMVSYSYDIISKYDIMKFKFIIILYLMISYVTWTMISYVKPWYQGPTVQRYQMLFHFTCTKPSWSPLQLVQVQGLEVDQKVQTRSFNIQALNLTGTTFKLYLEIDKIRYKPLKLKW